MTTDEIRRPPAPVIAVIALMALPAAAILVIAIVVSATGEPAGLLLALLALLPGAAALGLWQGNRGARVVAIMIGVAAIPASNASGVYSGPPIIYGATVILLLIAPKSSRAWFTPHRSPEGTS
ncbi:hypothetical protein ACIP2X_07285 [Streptomyces sp. NPDC089424]|uniref:hypothetical protein n=1 Tax=Streptomyces sp. NPDC089424 TaxID=3365917 RepID=UPI0037F92A67